MKPILALGSLLLSTLILTPGSFARSDSEQLPAATSPSVYEFGFGISYPDRTIRIGQQLISTERSEVADLTPDDGLYLLLLSESGQADGRIFSKDFDELLQKFPDRMVIGLSVQRADSGFNDQFFYGRLKSDLTGLIVGDFNADIFIDPANLEFPATSDAQSVAPLSKFEMGRVAHAGGALGDFTYSNSYEALDSSLARGFKYFEIDFVFTRDGHLVCLHDWEVNFNKSFGFNTSSPLSLSEFQDLVAANPRFKNCTLDGLADWMSANPEAYLVTDVKDENISALAQIAGTLPDAQRRVIPQIYHADEFDAVKAMGFKQIIWTLYRLAPNTLEVLDQVASWEGPVAITMPKDWANSGLALRLQARGFPAYAHTVNSEAELQQLTRYFGFTEIYTDFLDPQQYPEAQPVSP